jgi:cellobiose phosphorylase
MYRLITESLLGLRREGDSLRFEPSLPQDWSTFKMRYRYRETVYHIIIQQVVGAASVSLDGLEQQNGSIPLVDDRVEHQVTVLHTLHTGK